MKEKRKRTYYRLLVKRTPPHSWVNSSYYQEHDLYAFTESGARDTFYRYHKGGYGSYTVVNIREISKDEFRGQHRTADPELMSAGRAIDVAKKAGEWDPQVHSSVLVEYRNRSDRTGEARFQLHTDVTEEELKALWQSRHEELDADQDSIIRLAAW